MPRSLAIHPAYRPTLAKTLERNGFLTQGDLAANLLIALSTVNNFCRGQKVSVAKFEQICEALRYNVQQRLEHTFTRLRQDARNAYVLLCESSVYRCAVPEDWWLSPLEDWEQDEVKRAIALDVLRERYLVEEKIEDTELLLKQHNLIRSVSLAHLKQLTFGGI